MKFAYGCTRWVFLTERYAIKVARFRIIRSFLRLFSLTKKRKTVKTLERYDSNLVKAALKYVGGGILANRSEYRLYKKHGDEFLAPTLFSIFWIINIQERGEQSIEKDMRRHRLWDVLGGENATSPHKVVLHPRQFCVIKGKTFLADYGDEALDSVLSLC